MTKASKTIYWKDVLVVAVSVVVGIYLQRPLSDVFERYVNDIVGGIFGTVLVNIVAMVIVVIIAIGTIMFAIYMLARARGYEFR